MSKIATLSASVTLASSDEPDGDQIDFGPFISNANIGNSNQVAGIAGANTVSPAIVGEWMLANSANNVQTAGPYVTPSVFPMYFGLLPLMQTGGTLAVMGANTDTGVQVSSVNPSFIPVLANTNPAAPAANGMALIYVSSSQATPVKFFWA